MILDVDPAVVAHFHEFRIIRVGVHPVISFELLDDPFDSRFYAERTPAFDALERVFTV